MPTPVILLNIVWIGGLIIWAVWYYRRERAREKTEDEAKTAAISAKLQKQMKNYEKQYIPLPADQGAFPDYDGDGFILIDMAEAAVYHPPNDPLPVLGAKRALAAGDLVRVLMSDGHLSEDLWVEIIDKRPEDCFAGRIHAVEVARLNRLPGREIVFHANHIREIVQAPPNGAPH